MGRESVSPYQVAGRVGHLERRLRLPLAAVLDTDARTAPPDATVEEFFWQHLIGGRRQGGVVVDGDHYCGTLSVEDVARLDRSRWQSTPVRAVMRTDIPTAEPSWPLRDAIHVMEDKGVDRLVVCDRGKFVGVVTASELVQVDEILGTTEGG
jgi:CBS domain-containing protein